MRESLVATESRLRELLKECELEQPVLQMSHRMKTLEDASLPLSNAKRTLESVDVDAVAKVQSKVSAQLKKEMHKLYAEIEGTASRHSL